MMLVLVKWEKRQKEKFIIKKKHCVPSTTNIYWLFHRYSYTLNGKNIPIKRNFCANLNQMWILDFSKLKWGNCKGEE